MRLCARADNRQRHRQPTTTISAIYGEGSRTLETPHLLIDGAKMDRNIERMASIARECGVKLRPHVKTHKIPMIARRQLESGAAGITVAKVSEAEVMAEGGIRDIFIAYPLVTESKIRRGGRFKAGGGGAGGGGGQ